VTLAVTGSIALLLRSRKRRDESEASSAHEEVETVASPSVQFREDETAA
jgi:hypothetical protein